MITKTVAMETAVANTNSMRRQIRVSVELERPEAVTRNYEINYQFRLRAVLILSGLLPHHHS